jgi:lactoylglutathione lyase
VLDTQPRQIGFCVLYRWKLRSGLEAQHVAAWKRATQLIMEQHGGLGSRLHQAEDGTWYAYAQWPSKDAWQAHRTAPAIDPDIRRVLASAEEIEYPPICLTPVADFLLCGRCQNEVSPHGATAHLYETHLPVADTKIAENFYKEIVGLHFAYRDPSRDIVFLWADKKEKAMIGLWGPNTAYGSKKGVTVNCHVAFALSLDQLFAALKKLRQRKIDVFGFGGEKTEEPTVIGWMPSAQIYFRDPDRHMLEFISILPDPPNPSFNGPYSEWKKL